MMKPVLSKLKLKRLLLCQTQQQVADSVGISRAYVNSLENNRSHLTAEILHRFAKHYQCSVSELV
jgi:transcriptional regulator with XRE-family HTH domain